MQFSHFIPDGHDMMQVTVTGAKAGAVKALVELMYRGIAELQQVLQEYVAHEICPCHT